MASSFLLAEPPAAEESDDRPHHDGLKDLISRIDRVQARRPSGEQHLRKERGRDESEARVEPDEGATRARGPPGLVDEPVDGYGFDECRERRERVQRAGRRAHTHPSAGESHPGLPKDGAIPEKSDDHRGDGRDDDCYPVHVSLLNARYVPRTG